jgi:hypothetical protein
VTVTFHALWMLCALGAAVFAAAARTTRERAAVTAGFLIGWAAVSPSRLPDAALIGGLAAAAALVYLFRPRYILLTLAFGGALGGMLGALLQVQGVPAWLAPLAAAVPIAASMYLASTRPAFAPEVLREEGLLAITAVGLGVAVLPGVLDGWHAAANLSAAGSERPIVASVPMWTLAVLLITSCLGALYSSWSRR